MHTMYALIQRMRLTFIQTTTFASRWRQFRLTDEDLQALEQQLMKQPDAGDVMQGTGGLRKVRFAPPSSRTGKSGAFRVGYVYFRTAEAIVLLVIFAKSDQASLNAAEKARFKKVIESLRV
jgi:hypothetical protein